MPASFVQDRPMRPQAERTTIGALLVDPDRIIDVAPNVHPEDFYDPAFRIIYQTIRQLYEERKPIDFVTVSEALRGNPKIDALGGSAFIAGLADDVPTSAHAAHYASIVREKSIHRKLLDLAANIAELARDENLSADEAIEQSEQGLLGIARNITDNKPQHIADIGDESYERYTRLQEAEDKTALFGLTTGLRDLD